LSKVIKFPERKRKKMKIYKIYMTEEYILQLEAYDEEEAAEEAQKMVGNFPEDYCIGGSIQVERID
jgi:hypothetical protein